MNKRRRKRLRKELVEIEGIYASTLTEMERSELRSWVLDMGNSPYTNPDDYPWELDSTYNFVEWYRIAGWAEVLPPHDPDPCNAVNDFVGFFMDSTSNPRDACEELKHLRSAQAILRDEILAMTEYLKSKNLYYDYLGYPSSANSIDEQLPF